eukprot:TRINITY_DN19422_c0_g2_i1.p2 TRINITY_DN19422_c0_g2~~TRINITY_DN19422_c0_g2_i1.p2  ORF type:complete len:400 (+),score=118.94 TRINITY_DN19422_c0_g2_i1:67-1200(+)
MGDWGGAGGWGAAYGGSAGGWGQPPPAAAAGPTPAAAAASPGAGALPIPGAAAGAPVSPAVALAREFAEGGSAPPPGWAPPLGMIGIPPPADLAPAPPPASANGGPSMSLAAGASAAPVVPGREIVIKLRGCPFRVTEHEIELFLAQGLVTIVRDSIVIQQGPDGRPTGVVFVKVPSEDDAAKALSMQRCTLGARYIELYREDFVEPVAGEGSFPQSSKSGLATLGTNPVVPGDVVVKCRGLPFNSTEEDLHQFFSGMSITPDGINITLGTDGRPNGEAYVQFETAADLQAALAKDRQLLGTRYVEVYRSSLVEMQGGPAPQREPNYGGGYSGTGNSSFLPYGNNAPMRSGDWNCPNCTFHNFASRSNCKQCGTSKY